MIFFINLKTSRLPNAALTFLHRPRATKFEHRRKGAASVQKISAWEARCAFRGGAAAATARSATHQPPANAAR